MIEHKCEYCGKTKAYKSQSLVKRFCSHRCSNRWKWENIRKHGKVIEITCIECKKVFTMLESEYKQRIKKQKQFFCSGACYKKHVAIKPKKCQHCHVLFQPKDSRINFCCKACYCNFVKATGIHKRLGFWFENGYKVLYNNGDYIKEHIYVMEKYLGRKLKKGEVVHHIDGNKSNNDIKNLQLMTASQHSKFHRTKEISEGKPLFGRPV